MSAFPQKPGFDDFRAPAPTAAETEPSPFAALRADYARYLSIASTYHPRPRAYLSAATEFGFIAICVYRYGRWARGVRPWLLSLPFKAVYRVLNTGVQIAFGISLSTNSKIGAGFYIGHFGGIVVHGDLGARCSIGQGVTIGAKGGGRSAGYPEIGSDVYLGAGAMVIGHVRIGDGVIVGANTVVVEDVQAGCRVVSAPARVLPRV